MLIRASKAWPDPGPPPSAQPQPERQLWVDQHLTLASPTVDLKEMVL